VIGTLWAMWVNLVCGLWLVAAPFLFGFPTGTAAMWNSIIVGIIVVILSYISTTTHSRDTGQSSSI